MLTLVVGADLVKTKKEHGLPSLIVLARACG
jgi:hypothetical protein